MLWVVMSLPTVTHSLWCQDQTWRAPPPLLSKCHAHYINCKNNKGSSTASAAVYQWHNHSNSIRPCHQTPCQTIHVIAFNIKRWFLEPLCACSETEFFFSSRKIPHTPNMLLISINLFFFFLWERERASKSFGACYMRAWIVPAPYTLQVDFGKFSGLRLSALIR